jgi:hypothetical protein
MCYFFNMIAKGSTDLKLSVVFPPPLEIIRSYETALAPYLTADEDVRDLEEEDERLGVLVAPVGPEGEESLLLQLLLTLL